MLKLTAIWGLPGYTFKGIYKEIQKHLGSSVQNYLVAARTAQGYDEWHKSNREERLDVVKRWHSIQIEITREKQQARHGSFHGPQNFIKTQHLNHKEKQRLAGEKKVLKKGQMNRKKTTEPAPDTTVPLAVQTDSLDNGEFEEAIQTSIAATSRGNADEDRVIEQAIRASVLELQASGNDGDGEDVLQRAIKVSVAEAARARKSRTSAMQTVGSEDGPEHDKDLEDALHRSLTNEERHPLADANFDDSGVDTDDDENIKAAIHQSMIPATNDSRDKDLELALELSQQAQGEHVEQSSRAKTEEETVLEYVKKQSLVEDELKKRANAITSSTTRDPDDAGLQMAMKESLKGTNDQSRS